MSEWLGTGGKEEGWREGGRIGEGERESGKYYQQPPHDFALLRSVSGVRITLCIEWTSAVNRACRAHITRIHSRGFICAPSWQSEG